MTLDEMLAQAEIRQTITNYNIYGDANRKEELAQQFAEDGVLDLPGIRANGRAEIVALLKSFSVTGPNDKDAGGEPWSKRRHNLTTSQVVVNGEEATGRSYFQVVTDQGLDHQGVYTDRYRKIDGRWLIAERKVRLDWKVDAAKLAKMA